MTEKDLSNQKKEVERTIWTFLKGFDEFDTETIAKAWNKQGTLQFVGDDGIQIVPITKYYDSVENFKGNPDHLFHKEKGKKTIIDIDVCGTAARAKLKWEFPEFTFTDYYSLLKIDGQWKIVTKIWHRDNHPTE
jgi:protease I